MTLTRVAALLLLALPAQAYPDRLTRALSSYAVGGAGPMNIATLQAADAGSTVQFSLSLTSVEVPGTF